MVKKACIAQNCSSRAWHGEHCNYHALEQQRSTSRLPRPPEDKLAEGRRLLRAKAQELGIILDEPTPVAMVAVAAAKRRPSPMG